MGHEQIMGYLLRHEQIAARGAYHLLRHEQICWGMNRSWASMERSVRVELLRYCLTMWQLLPCYRVASTVTVLPHCYRVASQFGVAFAWNCYVVASQCGNYYRVTVLPHCGTVTVLPHCGIVTVLPHCYRVASLWSCYRVASL